MDHDRFTHPGAGIAGNTTEILEHVQIVAAITINFERFQIMDELIERPSNQWHSRVVDVRPDHCLDITQASFFIIVKM